MLQKSTLEFLTKLKENNDRDWFAANKKAFALSGWLMTLLVLGIMFAVIGYAMYAGVWQSPVPDELYRRLIPQAPMIGH